MGALDLVEGVAILGMVGVVLNQVGKMGSLLPKGDPTKPTPGIDPSTGLPENASPATQLGQEIGAAAGQAAAGAVNGAANTFLLNGKDVCQIIQTWRAQGAPGFTLLAGFPILPTIQFGGGNPGDWNTFRSWMSNTQFVDPGPTPPSCWNGQIYAGGGEPNS